MCGCSKNLLSFCEGLKLPFKNSDNLKTAFTHASFGEGNYERLEFLGDSVLKLVISDYLFNKYKNENEGKLTSIRAEIVSDKTLTTFAEKLEFDRYIILGKTEKRKGRSMDTIMACVFEAFLGAIYLEYGQDKAIGIISSFIFENFKEEIEEIEKEVDYLNPKAILQEYSQGEFHKLPKYNLVEETGLEHEKTFKIEVSINNKTYPAGFGSSKKEAQKNAAKNAITELGLIKKEEK